MPRLPMLSGSSLLVVTAPDDAVVLTAPEPRAAIADVGAAARDALRFPLAGAPLEELARRGGRATIVVEPPALPVPGAVADPRAEALAATVDELERVGIPAANQTILVAAGLARRPSPRDLAAHVPPTLARRFRGRVVVHDAEDPDLPQLGQVGHVPLAVNRALVETDIVVTVTAAESVLHGGPAALLAASGRPALRAAGAYSLLETAASQGWRVGVALERALAERVPVTSVSLVLNHPRAGGIVAGYPHDPAARDRLTGRPTRLALRLVPNALRRSMMVRLRLELTAAAAFGGPPSVSHAEALLRAIEMRSATLDGRLDAICIGIPPTTPYLPRERPNPLTAAYIGLGLALRMWRDAFPLAEGGTAILLDRFQRRFAHPTQQPYRVFFGPARFGRDPQALEAAEEAACDSRAIDAYRAGRTCHPLQPFVEWSACTTATNRLGAVVVAGCRDHVAARQLGFVPAHGVGAALEMVRGRAGENARIGFLLTPPYFPLRVNAPAP